MIVDPDEGYLAAILQTVDLAGRSVVEIGCGTGRVTGQLARHAAAVTALDPDVAALEKARLAVSDDHVRFLEGRGDTLPFPACFADAVIYTLSLHHIPPSAMAGSLAEAARVLRADGALVVIEPGEGGSLFDAKQRFSAGSGEEREEKETARRALESLTTWKRQSATFRTLFLFADADDFFLNMLPQCRDVAQRREVRAFLDDYRSAAGICLTMDRSLDVFRRITV